ncbi:SMODS domain-containing nucleotidyltransferase [Desulfomonile tiedjei]|uniref:Nucleotidyltransferase family protein n=1 Tax=Desulfomonile tiedjei (strain ATCC 49306 / DSM 6799 / DCB-1) TaxID=706587 RepID=I4C984_DESTA|nr:nucleotidyltransferase [Desulfomonile tiedjei]AFM26125.1 nucleotidyltransferase family protein [Desulfomonile tiedjei DSM 6799]
MSVNSYLTDLASDLVLSAAEKASIATSIATLKTRLDSHFGSQVTGHFQFGSSTRGTILPRKADNNSDIDYMVVFASSPGSAKKPQTYLTNLKTFVEAKYSTSERAQSHPTIVLSLNHISFELVPALSNLFGYQIPSPASSWTEWMSTDPSRTNKDLQDKNINNNSQIKPLVRLVKYWNAKNAHPFNSFSIEKAIIDTLFYSCSSLKDYFYHFWSTASYSVDTAQYIKDKVDSAKKHAQKAKEYEDIGLAISAELEIKKIVPEL